MGDTVVNLQLQDQRIDDVLELLKQISTKGNQIMATLEDLQREVDETTVAVNLLVANHAELRKMLTDAIASSPTPEMLEAMVTKLDEGQKAADDARNPPPPPVV